MAAAQLARTMPFPTQPSMSLQWTRLVPNVEPVAVMSADWRMTAPWTIRNLGQNW